MSPVCFDLPQGMHLQERIPSTESDLAAVGRPYDAVTVLICNRVGRGTVAIGDEKSSLGSISHLASIRRPLCILAKDVHERTRSAPLNGQNPKSLFITSARGGTHQKARAIG